MTAGAPLSRPRLAALDVAGLTCRGRRVPLALLGAVRQRRPGADCDQRAGVVQLRRRPRPPDGGRLVLHQLLSALTRVNNPNNPFIPGFPGSPPSSDNVLFNGININPHGAGGSYRRITLTPGLKHRLRIINPSVENTFTLSLVGHTMTVIATDFRAGAASRRSARCGWAWGQRYDVIITANQAVGNYWFNATLPPGPCGVSANPHPAAIFSYTGASGTPTTPGTAPPDPRCSDPTGWSPVVSKSAAVASFTVTPGDTLNTNIQTSQNGVARIFWPVNNSPMKANWGMPTLKYVQQGTTGSMPAQENVVSVPTGNTVRPSSRQPHLVCFLANLAITCTSSRSG